MVKTGLDKFNEWTDDDSRGGARICPAACPRSTRMCPSVFGRSHNGLLSHTQKSVTERETMPDQNIRIFDWAWDWNPIKFRIILMNCRKYFLKYSIIFEISAARVCEYSRISIIPTMDFEIHRSAHQLVTKIRSTADQQEIRCEQIFRRCPRIAHNRERSPT